MKQNKRIHVVMASAECAPFIKIGGLADVVGSLPQALYAIGVHTSVVLPKYGSIPKKYRMKKIGRVSLDYGRHKYKINVFHLKLPHNPVDYYFIEHALFKMQAVYNYKHTVTSGSHKRIVSDTDRFALFSEAVVESIQQLPLKADIIHCHDWQSGFIPVSVDQLAIKKSYPFTKTLFTIHNLAYQGKISRTILKVLDYDDSSLPYILEDFYDHDKHRINFLKLAILAADKINTVSPSYAKEIFTSKFGHGLEQFLIRRRKDVIGILNGIDQKKFDPSTDKAIYRRYSVRSWKKGKAFNKNKLQKELGLPVLDVPMYGIVTRLVSQKGLDLLEKAMRKFLTHNIQFIVLGTGEKKIEMSLRKLEKKYPRKVSATIDFDVTRARKIYAASNFFLMPSRFEPCGLGQMIAMRYGTIPLVRAVGGLRDTVQHGKTGIVFDEGSVSALYSALLQTLQLHTSKKSWYTMVERCMKKDFSWDASAHEYKKLYHSLL